MADRDDARTTILPSEADSTGEAASVVGGHRLADVAEGDGERCPPARKASHLWTSGPVIIGPPSDADKDHAMTTTAQREHRRIARHPVTAVLRRAAAGETIYPDQIEDLRLPDRQRRALEQAIRDVRPHEDERHNHRNTTERTNRVLRIAAAIADSLPGTWEDATTHAHRRAAQGDPDAQARVRAEAEALDHLAAQIIAE